MIFFFFLKVDSSSDHEDRSIFLSTSKELKVPPGFLCETLHNYTQDTWCRSCDRQDEVSGLLLRDREWREKKVQ